MISQSNVQKFYLLYYKQKQSLISVKSGIDGTEVSRGCGDYTMSLISIKSDVLHFFVAEQLSIADAYLVLNFYHCILDFILTASFPLMLSSLEITVYSMFVLWVRKITDVLYYIKSNMLSVK